MAIHSLLICNDRPYKFISMYGEKRNAYRVLVVKLTEKGQPGRPS